MTYMIVGGSSGLGRELAERFAQAGHALVLISSDLRDTRALASDLALRYDDPDSPGQCDLANLAGFSHQRQLHHAMQIHRPFFAQASIGFKRPNRRIWKRRGNAWTDKERRIQRGETCVGLLF